VCAVGSHLWMTIDKRGEEARCDVIWCDAFL
jgi:hypothetical protein